MDDAQFLTRIKLLKRLGWLALFGAVLIVLAYAFGADQLHPNRPLIVFGALALVPGLVYLIVLTIWHWKGRYRGQRQKWFAVRFTGSDTEINVANPGGGHKAEFVNWRWEPMKNLPDLIVPFKRPVYERVVKEFSKLAGD